MYFDGSILEQPIKPGFADQSAGLAILEWNATRGAYYKIQRSATAGFPQAEDLTDWTQAGETVDWALLPFPVSQQPAYFYRVLKTHDTPDQQP